MDHPQQDSQFPPIFHLFSEEARHSHECCLLTCIPCTLGRYDFSSLLESRSPGGPLKDDLSRKITTNCQQNVAIFNGNIFYSLSLESHSPVPVTPVCDNWLERVTVAISDCRPYIPFLNVSKNHQKLLSKKSKKIYDLLSFLSVKNKATCKNIQGKQDTKAFFVRAS